MAQHHFFITGATGLLGTEVVALLLQVTDAIIHVVVRARSNAEAEQRLLSLWCDDPVLKAPVGRRVLPVAGDITLENLALDDDSLRLILSTTTHVVHCAAETGVQKSKDELWKINVEGTRHVAQLAGSMPLLQRFVYVSTAYVAGTRSGLIREEEPMGTHFYSLYEQSKAEAERLVRGTSLPLTVCRPGMIVGNTATGRTRNFNTVYYVLKLMLMGRLPLLPVSKRQRVNVVPVDYVAQQIVTLALAPEAAGMTFHLTAPANELPRVGELVDEVRLWARENLRVTVAKPFCLSLPFLRALGKRYNAGTAAKSRNMASNLTALMPYFLDDHVFDRTNTDRLTGKYSLQWRNFLPVLLAFACRHNFMRLSDKTIFEQAVARRASHHFPITYYNIKADGIEQITGPEMNVTVMRYVDKLNALGVNAGDRVALSGINCSDHAAIDNAIGLVGAVSVPIYYTTPGEEIELLLSKSGARCFFMGDDRIVQSLKGHNISIPIVPFGPLADTMSGQICSSHHSFSSEEVSSLHSQRQQTDNAPRFVFHNSLATIRYTSGTTGEPKGVMFSFQQLKWMGEVLTNLLPWKERNNEMRYLSFLPMSHVVEGILAAYAPYCMLCKAKVYYLNDFQMLTRSLPQVRPTVFFSVPRFYEKLWEQIGQNALGRRYLTMDEGWLKTMVGRVLRRSVLRKSGLDRCSQLIVGSAPISEELLRHFRSLGIEIHNAYGQTEAPLITLNRLGDNLIPSIGTPLPDTRVSVAPDGELIVSGPQVAMGYYRLPSDTFSNGWLHTGDLGSISADGHVFISGRKKDMLITSYGKNINCSKVEQLLTDIPGVEYAVLVGEQRPFCTALLWLSEDYDTGGHRFSPLEESIGQMNKSLSHPEQVKRWCIIHTPLSVRNGELTPNLKVKRQVVWQHYEQEINLMYAHG